MSLRNKRIAILNDSTKYGRLTIMQQPIVHTYSLGELYTERKEKGDPSLPILTVSIHAGVSEGELDEDKLGKKVKRIADKTQYKTARKGDLVFNMMRAWQGAIGVVRSDGLVSPAYIVAKPNEKIWPEYMDYCMKTPRMIHAIHRQSYGVTDFRLRLYWDSFTSITCQLPTLPEQQKIAAILSTQDKVIELKEKLLVQKQQQKKYLMQQLLMPKNKEKSFKSIHLSDISRLIKKHVDGQKFNYVSTENISPNLSGKALFDESNIEISGVGFNAGDILVGNIRPYLKKVWRANKDGLCSTDVLVFRPIGISSEFLYYLIANDNFFFYVMTTAKGSKMPRGDKKAIMNTKMLIPESKIEQNFLVELLSTADHEIDLLQKSIEAEKQKKKALMQLLLTGKVSVRI